MYMLDTHLVVRGVVFARLDHDVDGLVLHVQVHVAVLAINPGINKQELLVFHCRLFFNVNRFLLLSNSKSLRLEKDSPQDVADHLE